MIKCCIFDLDGTLLDTLTTITYYVNRTLERYNLMPLSEKECKDIVGDGAALLIERALNLRGVSDKRIIDEALSFYKPDYDKDPIYRTTPFVGIREMLVELKEKKIKLAVLSNKPDTAVKGIINHFFFGIFDAVAGGKPDVPLKPNPTSALDIAKEIGVNASECAFIGDTGVDMRTGVNMGASLKIGVAWGFRERSDIVAGGADFVAETPEELLCEVLSNA